MATYRVTAPDGGTYRIEGPDDATDFQVAQAVLAKFPDSNKPPAPPDESKSGFIPALQAGFKGLKSDAAALAAKTGLMDVGAAENYIAKQREESAKIFQPTQDEWTESPWKKLKELAGGSAAYMAAPVVAGAATLALPATIAPAVATGIGMGLTGLVSGAQFTGSNLTRQMGEGASLADTELGSAALAAIPQAALDVLSLKMIPGVRGIFGAAGKKMTAEEAEAIATQGLKRTVADYTLATGKTMGVEGLTEAGQQVFERLQAGLSLTDEKAQKEYLDSFLGGAALGGAMAPVGRYFERGREQREAEVVGAMPGQRPGESLANAAQRLKNEIDAEKLNLLPPPAPPPPPVSPILSEQDLNNLPYGQIPAYIGTLQALPQTPEIRAAIKAANTASLNDTEGVVNDFLLKKLDEASRSLQPQADGAGDLSFLPADLSTVISAQLANSIGFVQNKSKTNIFDQIVGKDISDPDQAAAVIDILNKYKAGVKPGATSQNIDTFIESIPFFKPPATQGTVNVGTTDTAPGGESTVLASEPGAGTAPAGVAATQPDGMVSTGQDVTSTVGGEAAAPPSIEEMSLVGPSTTAAERQPSMLKEREAFGKATGAVRGAGGWNLSGRVNQPAAKAVMLEDTPGVLSALSKSKNVFTQKIAELASLIPGLKTKINPEASEQEDYSRRTADQNTVVAHTMHINQLDAMRELKPIVEQLPNDMDHVPYKLLSPYVLLPKDTIIDDLGNGNHEITLREFQRGATIVKKSFLNTLTKLEEETKELGEDRLRQSIGRVISKRTAIAGSFDRSTNTVEIQSPYFAKDENILTHEYTHAITSYSIDNPTAEQKPIVRKLQKLFEHVKENLGKVREEVNPLHNKQYANTHKPYGLTNIHEFVSEAWGNPDFQYWLSKVPYEKTTAWSKFVETIAQLLGIKDSNALTEAIALSEELVTAAKTGTEAQEKEYFSKRKPKEAAKPPAELSEVEKQDAEAIAAFKAEGPARIAEKTEQFKNILSKMLTRMGLKDVAVKIMDDIESKEAGGSYSAKLIKIALDVDKPVRTLRHEAIHALKELGFFSESQWKALTKQAKEGWIDTYLKNLDVNGEPLKEGEKSRYDIYMERPEFKSDPNAIIEEAIADAFGDFDTNGAPPGMLKAILNRLISFFDAIKSALQGNGIYTSEQAARQIFGKITRGELKAPSRGGPTTSGAQSSVQSGTQQGEASEQARSGEPALRPGDRGGEGSDGRDEEKLSVRGGRSEPTGDGGGRDKSGNDTPLAGAPTVQGGGPNPELVAVAEKYAKKYGIPYKKQSEYVELNVDRAKRLANAYEAMPNNPQDPKVKEAYADMIRQVRDQFDALSDSGYKFTFFDGETDPYDGNAWNAMRDLRATKTMAVYGTYDAYGPDGRTESAIKNNPMLADTGLLWKDQKGIERMVTANDLFRAVHDAFGHGLEGAGFRAQGEENAWQAHAKLFYGPALKALTSETRGQNSWVNYGSKGEKNRTAKVFDTDFADQKIGLMPDWTWKEGISKDEPVFQELDSRKDAKMFRNAVDRVKRGREYAFPLHVHDLETYQDARLFLSEDKESGFALIGDEIGSFFSGGGGQAYPTLRLAVEEGGRRIDAYRTKLPSVLGKAQFRPVARVEFNPEMATELWDFEKFKQFQNGNPDLVFYAYDPSFNPKGDLKAGDEAVAQTPLVEYEQAVELQVAATKYSLRGITLGTKQQDSVASSGVHYGKAKTDTLDASKYGTGLRGAESRRLETHWDDRIKKRVYFYIAKPDGTMPLPESGLGGYVYTQTFDNLAPPSVVSKLYSEARGDANTMESLIVDAGYDGYAVPKMGMMVVLNQNTPVEYQGTKAEYESKKQEKLSLRSIPLSTRGIMEANDAFARSELGLKTKAVRNRFNKVRDIAIALNRETLENQGQMNRKELTTDDLNTISRALADEVSYQLLSSSKTGTGLGWYSNNYPKAVKRLAKRFPELESNQHARAVFSALVAVTSNGEKVTKNISNAITLYARLRDGKPLVAMSNRRATALVNNLKQIEMLLVKYDTDFEKELKKEVTVADMNAYLRSVGKKADASYLANTRIPAAAIYFGPKLGAFYANLSGSEGYLTMDLWWTRTFNRMRGLLIPHATDASIDKFREMIGKPNATRDDILAEAVPLRDKYKEYSFNTELEHLVGKKEPDTKAGKIDWVKRARVVAEDAFDQLMYDNRLEKMANTIYKNEYEMLQEAPFSSSDRKFMYDAARRTQKLLQEEKINLSLADIQAALWYYEKRLYGKLSGKKADDIGYEEAIIKQSSEGRGRTRLSVVFDRGVDTGNVSARESGTPDEVGRVPSGSTEKLSLRVPGYLYHRSNLEKLASVENGDKFVLQPGPQGAEGEGVYFSQDEVVRETTAEGTTRKPQTAVVVIKTPLRDGWYVSKTGKTIKYGKPRTWHTENKTIDLQAVDVKTIEGEKVIFAKPISSWVNPDIRYSLRDKLGLYSELENKIEAVGPNQAPAPQWKAMIKGMVQKGVKPEEIEWSGVNDYLDLQEGKVTKAALLEYLKEGGVKVEETTLGDSQFTQAMSKRLDELEENNDRTDEEDLERQKLIRLENLTANVTTKYNRDDLNLILPGGTNYREVLLTLPETKPSVNNSGWTAKLLRLKSPITAMPEFEISDANGNVVSVIRTAKDSKQAIDLAASQLYTKQKRSVNYKSAHWDQPNVLAHIRTNDRVDVDGKKVLFVEEVQSDWGQEGREKGFIGTTLPEGWTVEQTSTYAYRNGPKIGTEWMVFDKTKTQVGFGAPTKEEAIKNALGPSSLGIPSAPFVTKTEGWLNLALKRIMVIAAEGGYDKVAFINGDQSAQRYNLAKYIDVIDYEKDDQGTYEFVATDKKGKTVYEKEEMSLSEIEALVGKDIAKKIEAGEGETGKHGAYRDWHTLYNIDLEVGEGKGMKVFYDQIVPIALKKLLSKVGGKSLNEVNINLNALDSRQILAKQFGVADSYSPQPGFDVTPEMKQKVETTGLPKFSLRRAYSPQWTNERIDSLLRQYSFTQNERKGDTQAYAALIKPRDFLDATSTKEYRKVLETERTPLDVDKLKNEVQPIYLEVKQIEEGVFEVKGHEGRHRMMALRDAGVEDSVPVVLVLRPYEIIVKDASIIEEPYFKPQVFGKEKAPKGFYSSDAIPISYKHKKDLQENFGRESDIKFSLRSTWRASANAAIDRTSVARIEEGWASRILNAISPKHFSEYRQVWLNRYNQLGVYDKQRADRMGGFGLLADASSEAAAMMSDYGAGLTAAVFSKAGGVPVFANGMTTISTLNGTVKGPLEIFSVLTKLGKGDPDIYRAYQLWAGVKRGKRFMPSTTNPNGTEENYLPSDIAEAAYYEKLYPEFVDVQKEWIKYNNPLSKYLVDTGVISAEGRKEWIKYADYIPFYRQVDDEQTVGPKLFQSLTGVKPPKKLKGGTDLPIADFLETIIRNTQSAIQMGIKNTAGQKAVTVALSLNTPGSTDVLEPLAYTSTTDDSITILVNGQKRSFRSQDKLWLQAVTSLNLPDVPFMGLFSKPAQLLRTLVTKEPGFMLANMIRDSMSSHVTSGIGSVNPATTIRNFAAAIAGKSPEFQALFNAGILGGHEYSKDIIQSGNKFASDLRKTSGFRTANEKLASPITGIWEALEKGTTASDAATRMQVYREVLAKTNNEAEAIYRAVEVMNFNRKGNSAIVRVLTAAIPFLNARMQGLDVFYRAAFGKGINQQSADAIQKQFFIRGATMMAMSCMYWALTHDDDEYKKQEQETKDNYWLLPSLGIKLPIPFEVGILFKVIPERIMALTFGTDTNKDFTESMVRQLSNTLSLNPIPQVAKPFIEYNTNYNFFTGRPIVGSGMEGVESGYQTGPNTSGIAADIGKATGMSPLKLDHLVGGFTGTMGMYAFSLMDSIYKINGDSTDASKRFEQSPVIKRFLIDPEARGTVSAYYEIKNSTDAAVRTAGLLERTMNYKEWGPYYKDNIKLLATHDYMLSLEKSMKDFREMKLMIRSSKLSPDEKRDALLNITKAENKLTSNIQVIKKNID